MNECVVCIEGSGAAVQPEQQAAHEDVYDEGLDNMLSEQGVQVEGQLGRGK